MNGFLLTLLTVLTMLFAYVALRSLPLFRGMKPEDWNEALHDYNRNSLYHRLNLLDVTEKDGVGVVIRKDGSFAAGFRIPGVESFYADPPALNEWSYRKEGLFRKIPIGENLKV